VSALTLCERHHHAGTSRTKDFDDLPGDNRSQYLLDEPDFVDAPAEFPSSTSADLEHELRVPQLDPRHRTRRRAARLHVNPRHPGLGSGHPSDRRRLAELLLQPISEAPKLAPNLVINGRHRPAHRPMMPLKRTPAQAQPLGGRKSSRIGTWSALLVQQIFPLGGIFFAKFG
jgi:hypothetical protein